MRSEPPDVLDRFGSDDESEPIYADELKPYLSITDEDARHETINHSVDEWVVGYIHTNSIEGVWSLFKRSIMGSLHKVSMKHIDRYLSELEWRFNDCRNDRIFIDALKRTATTDTLTDRELVV